MSYYNNRDDDESPLERIEISHLYPITPSFQSILNLKNTIIKEIIKKFFHILHPDFDMVNDDFGYEWQMSRFTMNNSTMHGTLFYSVTIEQRELCLKSLTYKERKVLLFYRQIAFHMDLFKLYDYNYYYDNNIFINQFTIDIYAANNFNDDFYNIHYRNNDSNIIADKCIDNDMTDFHFSTLYGYYGINQSNETISDNDSENDY